MQHGRNLPNACLIKQNMLVGFWQRSILPIQVKLAAGAGIERLKNFLIESIIAPVVVLYAIEIIMLL